MWRMSKARMEMGSDSHCWRQRQKEGETEVSSFIARDSSLDTASFHFALSK